MARRGDIILAVAAYEISGDGADFDKITPG